MSHQTKKIHLNFTLWRKKMEGEMIKKFKPELKPGGSLNRVENLFLLRVCSEGRTDRFCLNFKPRWRNHEPPPSSLSTYLFFHLSCLNDVNGSRAIGLFIDTLPSSCPNTHTHHHLHPQHHAHVCVCVHCVCLLSMPGYCPCSCTSLWRREEGGEKE